MDSLDNSDAVSIGQLKTFRKVQTDTSLVFFRQKILAKSRMQIWQPYLKNSRKFCKKLPILNVLLEKMLFSAKSSLIHLKWSSDGYAETFFAGNPLIFSVEVQKNYCWKKSLLFSVLSKHAPGHVNCLTDYSAQKLCV